VRRLVPLLVTALVLASCGGGNTTLSAADARKIASNAQLTVADLGSGWKKTADEKPDTSTGQDKQLEQCVGAKLSAAADTLAESHTRTFERSASDVDQQQIVVSSAVLSEGKANELFRVVSTEKFATCIVDAFESELKATGETGVNYRSDTPRITRDKVAGADHSAQITSPFTLKVDPLTFDGQVDLVMVTTGQAFSLLFGFSLGEPIGQGKLGRLSDLLVARQKV
jgi:hypothetical protein